LAFEGGGYRWPKGVRVRVRHISEGVARRPQCVSHQEWHMNQADRTAVKAELDRLTAEFFRAVSFEEGAAPAFEIIHSLFIEAGLLIKNTPWSLNPGAIRAQAGGSAFALSAPTQARRDGLGLEQLHSLTH
jgi:hypothetical protein